MRQFIIFICIITIATAACNGGTPTHPSTPQASVFDSGKTAYGFFPSPPEATIESIFQMYKDLGSHADVVLLQQDIPWEEFVQSADGESERITDITNQYILASQNNLEIIHVVDPLNGLNRREFSGLPANWDANFANPNIRSAFTHYALRIVRKFHPRYLGLASEINTYMDAYPDDAKNFVSLYKEIYALIKAEAPETQIFVSFQWEDLNNMFPQPEEGNRQRLVPNWEQVEAFEPNLDVWVISSYPYFVFPSGADIPVDYYSPLLTQTLRHAQDGADKPVAIAEGGFSTRTVGEMTNTPEDQVDYLNTVHEQLGLRLVFWVNTLLNDLNLDSYAEQMKKDGRDPKDAEALGNFAYIGLLEFDGSPKSALTVWDSFRK